MMESNLSLTAIRRVLLPRKHLYRIMWPCLYNPTCHSKY